MATAAAATADSQQSITVTPIYQPMVLDAGSARTVTTLVKNQTTRDFRIRAQAYDLPVRRDGSRSTEFVTAGSTPLGAGTWLKIVPATFLARAGTETPVRVRVTAPSNAENGDHLAGVQYVVEPTDDGGTVSISTGVDTYYFVQVGATARRNLDVAVRPLDRLHLRGGSITWAVTVRNRGNVHETVTGQLRVDGRIGSAPTQRLRGGVLLPGESRTERLTTSVRDAPDVLRATATVLHEDGSDVRVRSSARADAVYVLPWWLVVVVTAAVAGGWWRLRSRSRGSSVEHTMPIANL